MNTAALPSLPSKANTGKMLDTSLTGGFGPTSVTSRAGAGSINGGGNANANANGVPLPILEEDNEPRTYYLEASDPVEDSDGEDLEFDEIPVEQFDDVSDSDVDESLEQAIRNINEKNFFGTTIEPVAKTEEVTATLTKHPEVIDDFIRNYLSSKGLLKSLEAFQNEWYEYQQKEKLAPEDVTIVPDVYQQNQELADALQKLRVDVDNYKEIASNARATYDKLRKERDFHRMHHKRVVQEKNKLIADIKRLKKHYENYEPTLKQLQHKYEIAMKEKMLTKLERDRLATKVSALEASIKGMEKLGKSTYKLSKGGSAPVLATAGAAPTGIPAENDPHHRSTPGPGDLALPVVQQPSLPAATKKSHAASKDATLPSEDRVNPFANADLPTAKMDRFKQMNQVKGHSLAISSLKFHPKKLILATVSDDRSWKMWAFPSGELIMSGEGHKDWIADCDFHPRGTQLATASGDGTVKLWDFSKGIATLTMSDHTQAVWSCAFHDQGDFLASSSMDHTAKLWDIHTGRCRQTFRGHADSVNQVGWQPYSNMLYTCSGDKTVSIWDARTGLCVQTFFGHMNAINNAAFSLKGNSFASCDADGVVKFWDLRQVSELSSVSFGPHPANKLAFDPSGNVLAVASNDGSVKLLGAGGHERGKTREIRAHEDSVQAVVFDRTAEFLVTSGSDGTFKMFQGVP
ncbi:WD40-repeat-containing domain protein [Entophlyctis helioformis]|nr:WD40-repeat-containing domain protein [Entophlyctis helioformis]